MNYRNGQLSRTKLHLITFNLIFFCLLLHSLTALSHPEASFYPLINIRMENVFIFHARFRLVVRFDVILNDFKLSMARNHRCGTDQLNDICIGTNGTTCAVCVYHFDGRIWYYTHFILSEEKNHHPKLTKSDSDKKTRILLRENSQRTRKKCSQFIDHNNRSAWLISHLVLIYLRSTKAHI